MGNSQIERLRPPGLHPGSRKKSFSISVLTFNFYGVNFCVLHNTVVARTGDAGLCLQGSAEPQGRPRLAVHAHLHQLLHAADRLAVGQQRRPLTAQLHYLQNINS